MNIDSSVSELLRSVTERRLFRPAGNLGSRAKLHFYLERLFTGVKLRDAAVLDVGAGHGVTSFWAAAHGAREVIALEPELDGSSDGVNAVFRDLQNSLDLPSVDLRITTFQAMEPHNRHFDAILMNNTVNHLDEEACRALPDQAASEIYRRLFRKCAAMMAPGAALILADCGRQTLYSDIGLRNPFAPSIDWTVHQDPVVWRDLLEESGFRQERLNWTTPSVLGKPGAWVFDNRLASYLTFGHFVLVARVAE